MKNIQEQTKKSEENELRRDDKKNKRKIRGKIQTKNLTLVALANGTFLPPKEHKNSFCKYLALMHHARRHEHATTKKLGHKSCHSRRNRETTTDLI